MTTTIKQRSTSGISTVMVIGTACLFLLPVGLYAFEVARANLARTQLQASLDSATLAAANFVAHSAADDRTELSKSREMVDQFLTKQVIMSGALNNVKQSDTVDSDHPPALDVNFDVTIDSNHAMHTKAVYGLRPAFASFLGITTQPIRCTSGASYAGLTGDVCIALDISGSLAHNSFSQKVTRVYHKKSDAVTYALGGVINKQPALGGAYRSTKYAVPDLSHNLNLDSAPKIKSVLQGLSTQEEKYAFLWEVKQGNFESDAAYVASHADKGLLKDKNITPGKGYREEYQRIAIPEIQGLNDPKEAINRLLDEIQKHPGGHVGLVTFASHTSGRKGDYKDSFDTYANQDCPHVNLSKTNDNIDAVRDALAPAVAIRHEGTHIAHGLRCAYNMLNNYFGSDMMFNQRRSYQKSVVPRTIVLITDGTRSAGTKAVLKDCNEAGIRLYAVGYYNTPYSRKHPSVLKLRAKRLKKLTDRCGNGSMVMIAPDALTLDQIMRQIGHGTLSLTNS